MKKIIQYIAVALLAVAAPVAVTVPVAAQSMEDCVIRDTGENSENECEVEEEYTCEVVNENTVTITNSTTGVAESGTATVAGNGTGGNAVSGTASNGSNVTFNVVVVNGEGDEGDTCQVTVVPAPETPEPETPETPVQPTQKVTPKALPVTSGSVVPAVLASVTGLAAIAGVVIAYRRYL